MHDPTRLGMTRRVHNITYYRICMTTILHEYHWAWGWRGAWELASAWPGLAWIWTFASAWPGPALESTRPPGLRPDLGLAWIWTHSCARPYFVPAHFPTEGFAWKTMWTSQVTASDWLDDFMKNGSIVYFYYAEKINKINMSVHIIQSILFSPYYSVHRISVHRISVHIIIQSIEYQCPFIEYQCPYIEYQCPSI